jgi:thioredoxin 1
MQPEMTPSQQPVHQPSVNDPNAASADPSAANLPSRPNIYDVGEADFDQQVLAAPGIVLVDFWSPQCGPCRRMNPILQDLANSHPTDLKIVKVNINDNYDLAVAYNVGSLPTFKFFKNGTVVHEVVGAVSKASLEKDLTRLLQTP